MIVILLTNLGQEAVINFTLQVGAVEQTVAATADAPLVDTTSGTLGGLVDDKRILELPLNGRHFESLSLDEWRAASDLFERDVISRVAPRASAAAKKTPQSTAPAAVHARLAEVQRWLQGL